MIYPHRLDVMCDTRNSSVFDVEIASGLTIGAMVILHPGDSVTEGIKLSIQR